MADLRAWSHPVPCSWICIGDFVSTDDWVPRTYNDSFTRVSAIFERKHLGWNREALTYCLATGFRAIAGLQSDWAVPFWFTQVIRLINTTGCYALLVQTISTVGFAANVLVSPTISRKESTASSSEYLPVAFDIKRILFRNWVRSPRRIKISSAYFMLAKTCAVIRCS